MLSALMCVGPRAYAYDHTVVYSHSLVAGGATLQVDFAPGAVELPRTTVIERIQTARPGGRALLRTISSFTRAHPDRSGGRQERSFAGHDLGDVDGFPAYLRIRLGELTTPEELAHDWIITHELVHTAMVSLPDNQQWMEEGLATYIEPIARVQAGELTAESIWADMVHGMPKGEPGLTDRGLDRTRTWGRTLLGRSPLLPDGRYCNSPPDRQSQRLTGRPARHRRRGWGPSTRSGPCRASYRLAIRIPEPMCSNRCIASGGKLRSRWIFRSSGERPGHPSGSEHRNLG